MDRQTYTRQPINKLPYNSILTIVFATRNADPFGSISMSVSMASSRPLVDLLGPPIFTYVSVVHCYWQGCGSLSYYWVRVKINKPVCFPPKSVSLYDSPTCECAMPWLYKIYCLTYFFCKSWTWKSCSSVCFMILDMEFHSKTRSLCIKIRGLASRTWPVWYIDHWSWSPILTAVSTLHAVCLCKEVYYT